MIAKGGNCSDSVAWRAMARIEIRGRAPPTHLWWVPRWPKATPRTVNPTDAGTISHAGGTIRAGDFVQAQPAQARIAIRRYLHPAPTLNGYQNAGAAPAGAAFGRGS
jgi:hypothetical protein